MQSFLDLFKPLHIESWYVLVAFVLAFALQVSKKTPYASKLWALLPPQWRWLWTVVAGFAVGFVQGYMLGLPAVGSVLTGIGGAFGVGLLAGGINDWLEKSVLPWPGSVAAPPITAPEDKPPPADESGDDKPDDDKPEPEDES